MPVSMTMYCIGRSFGICNIVQPAGSLGTRLIITEERKFHTRYYSIVVVRHRVDDHIEYNTLCRLDVDPIVVERLIVHHVVDNFINDDDEQLFVQSESSDGE